MSTAGPEGVITAASLLKFATEMGASDLHISAGEPPMVRIHGDLARVDLPALLPDEAHRIVFEVMSDAQLHSIDDYLSEDWLAAWAAQVVQDVEAYLRKHAAFSAFLDDETTLAD